MKKIILKIFSKILNKFNYTLVKQFASTNRTDLQEISLNGSSKSWKMLTAYCSIVKKIIDVPGDFAEFGVASGTSFMTISKIISLFNESLNHKIAKKYCFGFDTFEGLPYLNEKLDLKSGDLKTNDLPNMKVGGFNASQNLNYLNLFLKKNNHCNLLKGKFEDTLPKLLEEKKHLTFSLIHIDCDLYDSTRFVLKYVLPRLNIGGVILFDELFNEDFPGETLGFLEVINNIEALVPKFEYKLERAEFIPWKWYLIRTK